jgi:superfamily II DNA or RNA helicase/HKD family nuclease
VADRTSLSPGLWEKIVSLGLADDLASQKDLEAQVAELDPAEAPLRLAQYLSPLIERALGSIGDDRPADRVALVNAVVELLRGATNSGAAAVADGIAAPARVLQGLVLPRGFDPQPKQLARPTIPLSDTWLLTNARDEPAVGREIQLELETADNVDLLCAFVRFEGVRILEKQLRAVIERGGRLRVITTTYLQSTEQRAVDMLVGLGAEMKIAYELEATRLHAKAWLFHRRSGFTTGFIGSSNLSKTALLDGLEWNVRLSSVATPNLIQQFEATFESYWQASRFETYYPVRDHDRLDRALLPTRISDVSIPYVTLDIQPRPLQRRILEELEVERERHGRWQNLVVAATGTGKTVIAALDYRRICETESLPRRSSTNGRPRLLFVAHRREILTQTLSMFRTVLRDGAFGELYVDGHKPDDWSHVFASVQSLDRRRIDEVPPDYFDVVIIDEFHHAAAPTYRRLLEHFKPALLLGLTATPERTDGESILDWFGGRMASEVRLWEAIDEGELVPFQYFGVSDDVPLAHLEWKRGGYVAADLDKIYTGNDARVLKIVQALNLRVTDPMKMRALGFCVSIEHARFMARRFNELGIVSEAITSETASDEREGALRRLRQRELNVVFAVDIFNEGVDVPEVDTVLFLRPTESATLFLQQLGRGLRRVDGKAVLTVLDFIGRQRAEFRFDRRFQAITGRGRKQTERDIAEGFSFLPAGCHIELDPVARDVVLENVRQAIGARAQRLVEELKRLGDVSLDDFLQLSGAELSDVYRPGRSWTSIRRRAGFEVSTMGPDEDTLVSAIGRMLHVEDSLRLGAWRSLLMGMADASLDARLVAMLYVNLSGTERKGDSVAASLARLRSHPAIVRELLELFDVLDSSSHVLSRALSDASAPPLALHARYTQSEALAAVGASRPEAPLRIREGVYFHRETDTDLIFVTLQKSERDYSPTTRYRDYAISPTLFHWESQSTTTADSPTGRRYQSTGRRPLLFVRKAKQTDQGSTAAYTYVGPAGYVSRVGEHPMAITWRLENPMPADLFEQAAVVAV